MEEPAASTFSTYVLKIQAEGFYETLVISTTLHDEHRE
jgi:hypothetical protein